VGWITGEDDGAGVGLTDGCAVVGLSVVGSLVVGLADGGFTGDVDGACVGFADGCEVVGSLVVGLDVGWLNGDAEGAREGLAVGCAVVGSFVVGLADGGFTGDADGAGVVSKEGSIEGLAVGSKVVGFVLGLPGVTVEGCVVGAFDDDIDGPSIGASEVTCIVGFAVSLKSRISKSFDILNIFRGITLCCSSIVLTNSVDECSLLTPPPSVRLTFVLLDEFAANAAAGKRQNPVQTFIIKVVASLRTWNVEAARYY
jgi:hypothetical protein